MTRSAQQTVIQNFAQAAEHYDEAASVQAHVAACLVQKAAQTLSVPPQNIIDLGCGTGLVAEAAARAWPQAQITMIDGAPSMLYEARRKLPRLHAIRDDIAALSFKPAYDLILSSMALHWLPDTAAMLSRWQKGLKPGGRLFAALLVEGSFDEWRTFCKAQGEMDGLWCLPRADFADEIACNMEIESLVVDYPSAKDFLRRLKTTGAATACPDHEPLNIMTMRRLLAKAPEPFTVTYQVLYIEAPSPDSI